MITNVLEWGIQTSLNHYYSLNIISKFKKYPNINLGLIGKFSNYTQNAKNYNYNTYAYKLGISYGLKHFFGELNWSQEQVFNSSSKASTYNNLDITMSYTNKTSPFGFELSLINILNENQRDAYIFNDYYSGRQTIFYQGFRAMFKISYML